MKVFSLLFALIDISDAQTSKSAKGLTCAPGWSLNGDRCMFREEIDFFCDGKKWSKYGNTCMKSHAKFAEPVCEPGYYLKQVRTVDWNDKIVRGKKKKEKNCASKEKVDAILSCPDGFTLESRKKCVRHEIVPALGQDCGGIGYSNTGVLGDGTLACALGAYYDKKSHACWIYEEIRPQRTCPYPYVQFGEVSTGWRCQLRDRMPVAFVCPKDYEMHEDGVRICVKKKINDKKKFCPPGWKMSRGTVEDLDFLLSKHGGDFKKDTIVMNPIIEDKCVRYVYDLPLEMHRDGKGFSLSECKAPFAFEQNQKLLGEMRTEKYDIPEQDFEGLMVGILE
eukprot:GDKJ01027965.1.p1 GENE.GDKJ01027965.1~~GDKJ01027965.1.p1  ORF type:complete len:336 (-),score=48.69 GDKJ01027965.1:133-1140(-)